MKQLTQSEVTIIYQSLISYEIELKKLIASSEAAIKNLPMSEKQCAEHFKCIAMWRRELAQCLDTQLKFKF